MDRFGWYFNSNLWFKFFKVVNLLLLLPLDAENVKIKRVHHMLYKTWLRTELFFFFGCKLLPKLWSKVIYGLKNQWWVKTIYKQMKNPSIIFYLKCWQRESCQIKFQNNPQGQTMVKKLGLFHDIVLGCLCSSGYMAYAVSRVWILKC